MEIKEAVLDRIEQSFGIFKNHFLEFFLPIFLFTLSSFFIFGSLLFVLVFYYLPNSIDVNNFDLFVFLNDPKVMIFIILGIILLIVYLILYIPFYLGLLKSIKQSLNKEEITPKDNVLYGFSKLLDAFRVYWYIFAYVALIPSLIFILGGFIFNLNYFYLKSDVLGILGGFLMILGGFLMIAFLLYRGYKAYFSMYGVVDSDNYSKEIFLNTVKITNNNWWRIVGNIVLTGLIVGLLSTVFTSIFSLISHNSFSFNTLNDAPDINTILGSFFSLSQILSSILNYIISVSGNIFIIVFSYLLYLRLKYEANNIGHVDIDNKKLDDTTVEL